MKLSIDILNEILEQIAITPIATDEEVMRRSTVPNHFKDVQANRASTYVDGKLIHLSTSNTKLNNILESITKRKTEDVIAFHLMESNPPSYTSDHLDTGSDLTLVILLEDNFEGGYVYIKNERYEGMRTRGEYMMYCGNKVRHGVSEITKGTRK